MVRRVMSYPLPDKVLARGRRPSRDTAINERYVRTFGKSWLSSTEQTLKRIEIKDLPFMMTSDGTIVCIPKMPEMGVIALIGLSGKGKCIYEDEKVIVNGEPTKASDIARRFDNGEELNVITLNSNLKTEEKKIIGIEKVQKECSKITTEFGEELYFSPDHKFLVLNDKLDIVEKKINEITERDFLIKASSIPQDFKNDYLNFWELDHDLGWLCGIYLAEGSLQFAGINLSNCSQEIKNNIIKICQNKNLNFTILKSGKGINIKSQVFNKFIDYYFGEMSGDKYIHKEILKSNEKFLNGLLCGYFDGDGCVNQTDLGWVSKSYNLSWAISNILLKLGIANGFRKIKKNYRGILREYYQGLVYNSEIFKHKIKFRKHSKIKYLENRHDSDYYILNFYGLRISKNSKDIDRLVDKYRIIRYLFQYPNSTAKQLSLGINMTVYKISRIIPTMCRWGTLKKECIGKQTITGKSGNGKLRVNLNSYKYNLSFKLMLTPEEFELKVRKIIDSDVYLCKIKKIEKFKDDATMYHISVEDNHNYMLQNGIISCNSLNAGFILDNLFWHWGDNIALINDSQAESFDWSEPCENKEFITKLKMINQNPMPLPLIYLFPKMYEAKEEALIEKNSINISLPFREVLNRIESFIPNLGNSTKYLLTKKDDLLECESEEEIMDILASINTGEKGMSEVVRKLQASFKELIDEGILNISDPTAPSYLRVGNYFGNPFTAVMKADCIPSFITDDLYVQKYKDLIFSYYIHNLFIESLKGEMKGKRVWLYFEELTKVVSADARYTNAETEKELNNVVARGRNNGISLIYATQRYKEIPKPIRGQTKYSIVFRHNSKEETKEICDDFGVEKGVREEILSLKKFEAIAFTTEYFVCYKKNRVWQEQGPIKGYIFPALHKNRFLSKEVKGGSE